MIYDLRFPDNNVFCDKSNGFRSVKVRWNQALTKPQKIMVDINLRPSVNLEKTKEVVLLGWKVSNSQPAKLDHADYQLDCCAYTTYIKRSKCGRIFNSCGLNII